jgi:hypothetical protein
MLSWRIGIGSSSYVALRMLMDYKDTLGSIDWH